MYALVIHNFPTMQTVKCTLFEACMIPMHLLYRSKSAYFFVLALQVQKNLLQYVRTPRDALGLIYYFISNCTVSQILIKFIYENSVRDTYAYIDKLFYMILIMLY